MHRQVSLIKLSSRFVTTIYSKQICNFRYQRPSLAKWYLGKKKNAAIQKYLKDGEVSMTKLIDAINLSKNKYFKSLDDKPNNPGY